MNCGSWPGLQARNRAKKLPFILAGQAPASATGNPEVVVRRKGRELFALDPKAFERIKGDEMQMCAGMTLSMVHAPQLVVVRTPSGAWEVAY